MRECA